MALKHPEPDRRLAPVSSNACGATFVKDLLDLLDNLLLGSLEHLLMLVGPDNFGGWLEEVSEWRHGVCPGGCRPPGSPGRTMNGHQWWR